MIIGCRIPTTQEWVLADSNTPFGDASSPTAKELSKLSLEELHQLLAEDAQNAIAKCNGKTNSVALELE